MEDKVILVAGATGRQGGAVVRHLQKRKWRVRALTRNASGPTAMSLAAQGIEVVQGDMNDPLALATAMENAYGVFSVQDFWIVGAKTEIQQGKNMAEAARDTGVQHFVYSSVEGADKGSGVDHFESKFVIEEHIRGLGLPTTVLRPVGFMENYHIPRVEKSILKGTLAHPNAPDKKVQLIPTDDIGAFAAAVFDEPQRFIGQSIDIASDELTNSEVAATFSKVLGRTVHYKKLPMLIVRLFMGKELHRMFRWYNKEGFNADISALRRTFPNVELTSLEEWLRRDGWSREV